MLSGCASKEPTVTGVNPSSALVGETLDVTVTGDKLTDASDVDFGAGITVNSFTVDSETEITANITVADDATEGGREVSVTTPEGTATKTLAFTVGENTALEQLIQAAEAEGVLNVWATGAMSLDLGEAVEAAMNAKYGIDIDIEISPGTTPAHPQIISTLIQEFEAGEKSGTDLVWVSDAMIPLMYDAGILRTYDWTELFPYIPDELIQLEGTAVESVSSFYWIAYNTDAISEAEAPRMVEDVLGKGWAIGTTPYFAGFSKMADHPDWGYERALAFVEALNDENLGFVGGADEARVASGEFDVIIFGTSDRIPRKMEADNPPLKSIVPEDMPIIGHEYFGVPKHSEHPNLAALFSGFLLTLEGQQILDEVEKTSHHGIEGTYKNTFVKDLMAQGMEYFNSTADYVGAPGRIDQYEEWRSSFQGIVFGGR
jgi:ABC-type Fe3+ transport system substrate-binding protein